MSDSYTLIKGRVPIFISMPHNGEKLPNELAKTMTPFAQSVPDTDWYKDRLYDFAQALGAYIIIPTYSRYVIDLNRDPKGVDLYPGANSTELCPTSSFDMSPLYLAGKEPSKEEIDRRITLYWQPYHQAIKTTLAEIKEKFSVAVLLEAHSILSHVPRFFDGQLPDFNFGSANGESCASELLLALEQLNYAPYSMVSNGRFKGGYITRAYGNPKENIHAIQLELSQRTYLDEPSNVYNETLAVAVKPKLEAIVHCLINFAGNQS